jgi:predicted nuclease of restriction endonuclease-like (RecB) superfamily
MAPREKQFLPQAVAEIPWGHNVTLLEKLKDSAQRTWYARQATANGWSRSMLDHWIESDLPRKRQKLLKHVALQLVRVARAGPAARGRSRSRST